MGLKFYYVITLYILSVNEWFGNAITMHLNKVDLLYQRVLKIQHHAENYMERLAQDITPYGLQLKKKAAISSFSPDFKNRFGGTMF